MEIPIQAKVFCTDGECGYVTRVLINPLSKKVTHLIVKDHVFLGYERMVPAELIDESFRDKISINLDLTKFHNLEGFVDLKYIGGEVPYDEYLPEHYYLHPFVVPDYEFEYDLDTHYIEIEHIPPGELVIYPGSEVYTEDGFRAGKVDELLISTKDEKITHLVLREGHLWGQKHVTIPVSMIDHIEIDGIYLTLTKDAVRDLPTIPVRRP